MKTAAHALAIAAGMAVGMAALAQTVTLSGMLGGKALLLVDGSAPKLVAVGETYRGVKVIATNGDFATVDVASQRHNLKVGETPASVAGLVQNNTKRSRLILAASQGGHFAVQGKINGRSARFLVDTGATEVGMSVAEAQRMGIEYKSGLPVSVTSSNGVMQGWLIKLATVTVGDVVVHGVDAVVSTGVLPVVLLGNSYLDHFNMTRTHHQMVLEKRY